MAPLCLSGVQNAAVPLPSHRILHPFVFPKHCLSVWHSYLCFCFLPQGFSFDRIECFFKINISPVNWPPSVFLAFFDFYPHYKTLHIVFPLLLTKSGQNLDKHYPFQFSSKGFELEFHTVLSLPLKVHSPLWVINCPYHCLYWVFEIIQIWGNVPLFLISWNTKIQVLWCMMPGLLVHFICPVTVY